MAATPPDSAPAAHDARLAALERWLAERFGGPAFTLAPASADASFRRYFRARFAAPPRAGLGQTLVVMDAPPPQENCRPFVHVAALLADAGLNAPRVLEADLERGFLALTDLGDTTYLAALEADRNRAGALFSDATDALVRWQRASREGELPPYDAALLRRELDLFPEWYVARHLNATLSPAQRETLERAFALLIASALAQPKVYVHRDFMPRNLMVDGPNPGILDFQDAVHGPIAYDVVSLFRDAFISWEEEAVLDWTIRYWEKARGAGLPVAEDFGAFYRQFEWMGLQRHLKVAGIFARLAYRDGKPAYLADTPRFIGYIRTVCGRYDALRPLAALVDEIEARPRAARYTF
jgi:aminoglycoside/choline kinase family phosphotransferase